MASPALSPSEFIEECIEFKRSRRPVGRYYPVFWLAHAPTVVERDSARLIARNLAGELGLLGEGGAFRWTVIALEGVQLGFDAYRD